MANEDSGTCIIAKAFAYNMNKKSPYKIDEVTKLIKASSDCRLKTIYTTKQFFNYKQLPANIDDVMQKQHTERNCDKKGLSFLFGWTAISYIYDKNSVLIFTLKTSPKDC